ncbi:Chemotaxis histidine kinase, CheA (contains CheW-like adaptor domain) [Carnobacterium sp. AT7]|uniref:chemotaxis protein CheA n=1 Tax=Carnobacterium sp. AT7 TaxID=333990 RepID=UPI00015F3245|nr:chemotaxis protein CheA [Carnobacterium sp. AT7]EDP69270.1 Chemotaxis histidine kinase, CheA (contains CheW-like adaptor domain) [Carnobacterium sp. AT7]
MDENSKYLDLFFEETDEHLQSLNEQVLELENNPEDSSIVDVMFRSAHTIKGMAATMGYDTMAKLTHKMENVFDLLKQKIIPADATSIALIFDCLDTLSDLVEDLREENDAERDITNLVQRLDHVSSGESALVEAVTVEQETGSLLNLSLEKVEDSDLMIIEAAKEDGYNAYVLAIRIDEESSMKNARVYLVMSKLEQHGDVLYSEPGTEALENDDFGTIFKLIYVSKLDEETVLNLALDNSEIAEVLIQTIQQADDLLVQQAEKSQTEPQEKLVEEQEIVELVEATQATAKAPGKAKAQNHAMNQSIRVDIGKLDSFMNLVSELVIYRTRLEDLSDQLLVSEMKEPLEHVARISSELQELVLKIRMQPVSTVMTRFPRMIRDLGNDLGKEFNLVIEGEDTELDRTVVSELSEPLVHLLRNSADHGVEMPEERLRLGKNPKGLIKITAYQEGNRVVLTLTDDGKGVNPVVIKASAERKGISTEGMSDKEIQQLIFHPGFSTAQEVTSISGRGVGMDAVKQKITELGGTVELESIVGKGTVFKINLPLTLSIIQSLLVKVGQATFAIPLGIIKTIVKVKEEDIIRVHNREVYKYEGLAVPVVRLHKALDVAVTEESNLHLVLVKQGDNYNALAVDDLVRQQEIVIKKLGQELNMLKNYLGATILGDGSIVLILDASAICNESIGEYSEI